MTGVEISPGCYDVSRRRGSNSHNVNGVCLPRLPDFGDRRVLPPLSHRELQRLPSMRYLPNDGSKTTRVSGGCFATSSRYNSVDDTPHYQLRNVLTGAELPGGFGDAASVGGGVYGNGGHGGSSGSTRVSSNPSTTTTSGGRSSSEASTTAGSSIITDCYIDEACLRHVGGAHAIYVISSSSVATVNCGATPSGYGSDKRRRRLEGSCEMGDSCDSKTNAENLGNTSTKVTVIRFEEDTQKSKLVPTKRHQQRSSSYGSEFAMMRGRRGGCNNIRSSEALKNTGALDLVAATDAGESSSGGSGGLASSKQGSSNSSDDKGGGGRGGGRVHYKRAASQETPAHSDDLMSMTPPLPPLLMASPSSAGFRHRLRRGFHLLPEGIRDHSPTALFRRRKSQPDYWLRGGSLDVKGESDPIKQEGDDEEEEAEDSIDEGENRGEGEEVSRDGRSRGNHHDMFDDEPQQLQQENCLYVESSSENVHLKSLTFEEALAVGQLSRASMPIALKVVRSELIASLSNFLTATSARCPSSALPPRWEGRIIALELANSTEAPLPPSTPRESARGPSISLAATARGHNSVDAILPSSRLSHASNSCLSPRPQTATLPPSCLSLPSHNQHLLQLPISAPITPRGSAQGTTGFRRISSFRSSSGAAAANGGSSNLAGLLLSFTSSSCELSTGGTDNNCACGLCADLYRIPSDCVCRALGLLTICEMLKNFGFESHWLPFRHPSLPAILKLRNRASNRVSFATKGLSPDEDETLLPMQFSVKVDIGDSSSKQHQQQQNQRSTDFRHQDSEDSGPSTPLPVVLVHIEEYCKVLLPPALSSPDCDVSQQPSGDMRQGKSPEIFRRDVELDMEFKMKSWLSFAIPSKVDRTKLRHTDTHITRYKLSSISREREEGWFDYDPFVFFNTLKRMSGSKAGENKLLIMKLIERYRHPATNKIRIEVSGDIEPTLVHYDVIADVLANIRGTLLKLQNLTAFSEGLAVEAYHLYSLMLCLPDYTHADLERDLVSVYFYPISTEDLAPDYRNQEKLLTQIIDTSTLDDWRIEYKKYVSGLISKLEERLGGDGSKIISKNQCRMLNATKVHALKFLRRFLVGRAISDCSLMINIRCGNDFPLPESNSRWRLLRTLAINEIRTIDGKRLPILLNDEANSPTHKESQLFFRVSLMDLDFKPLQRLEQWKQQYENLERKWKRLQNQDPICVS